MPAPLRHRHQCKNLLVVVHHANSVLLRRHDDRAPRTMSSHLRRTRTLLALAALHAALAQRPGEVFSREELISRTGASGGGRAVDVQVTRLRRKIEIDPRMPRYLQTVRGKGYVLRPD